MKIQYDFYFIFERLGRMHETKHFIILLKKNVLTKNIYFNIGFVSLQ
jgi:hypothetical protein